MTWRGKRMQDVDLQLYTRRIFLRPWQCRFNLLRIFALDVLAPNGSDGMRVRIECPSVLHATQHCFEGIAAHNAARQHVSKQLGRAMNRYTGKTETLG